MASTVPQVALVPRRKSATGAPVRQALVDALIGAVLDELGAVDVARPTPAATKTLQGKRSICTVSAEG